MGINNQGFEYGVYPLLNGVLAYDPEYGIYPIALVKANIPPAAATVLNPAAGARASTSPTFVFTVAPDTEGSKLHFKIDVASNNTFMTILQTYDTRVSTTSWRYQISTDGGSTFGTLKSVPSSGIPSVPGELYKVTYAPASNPIGTYGTAYWRVLAHDGQDYSIAYTTNSMIIGDRFTVTLNTPVDTGSVNARSIIAVVAATVPPTPPAEMKVYACNNAFDAFPTWENITSAVLTRNSYAFTNTTKTAAKYGVNIRIEIYAYDVPGVAELKGFGFNFN
jgi:hypothetical protein